MHRDNGCKTVFSYSSNQFSWVFVGMMLFPCADILLYRHRLLHFNNLISEGTSKHIAAGMHSVSGYGETNREH